MPVNFVNIRGTQLRSTDSREQYREKIARITLDSMVQFVGLLDGEGTVIEINQVALDAVGIALADVEGQPFWTTFWWRISPESNRGLQDMIRRAAAGEFVRWDAEILGRTNGTGTITIDASLTPVRDATGKVAFLAFEGRDITEKKAGEREIAQKNLELKGLLERIRELEQLRPIPLPPPALTTMSQRPTVVVVEDDPEMNRFVADCLSVDYEVVVAFNGLQGLEQALRTNPSLIVTDIVMPKVSGDEMIAAMRRHPELASVPVILLTAKADEKLKTRLLGNGAQDFVAKPFPEKDLLVRAKNLIELRKTQESHRTLFNSMDQGFCLLEVVFDPDQTPADLVFVEVNAAFTRQTGLPDARGRRVSELAPTLERHWFEIYGRIALTGEPTRFENRAEPLGRWYEVYAFRVGAPASRQVAVFFTDITERVKTQEELTAVRRRLDSALLAGEIGTYEWDVVSDHLHGDPNLARLFGMKLDATGGAPLADFLSRIHPGDRESVTQGIQHSVATGENFEADYRIMLPSGERWVTSRGRMIRGDAGRVVNFFGLLMDITSRKRAEAEREAIAERLRRLTAIHETVLGATNDFAYVFDLDGRFIYANRALLELYGRPLDQVAGHTFLELGYPAWHAEMHLREIAQVISTKKPIQGEIPFKGESGKSGVYDYIFTPVFGADGRVEAVAGTTRDVTERKAGEVRDRLLVDLDDATRPLTDPDAITQASARLLTEYLGVNRCAYAEVEADENTFNLTGDFNRDVPSIVGRYRFDQFGVDCLRLMRAGEPYVVTDSETDLRLEGAVRESYRATQIRSVICVPLMKSGRFIAAMAVHQNIPRSWLESDIEAVQLVASRCWESIERARIIRMLAESEKEAVQASRAKDDFLAMLSHELRTPLNPILLLASDAEKDEGLPVSARSAFATIRKSVELEARLIDDLLDLTAITRGKLAIKKTRCDLHGLLHDAVATVRPDFVDKSVSLNVHLDASQSSVYLDEVRVVQVFINLLKNAVKFTSAGGTVTLGTSIEAGNLIVRLADTGIGLTTDELERVFEPFEQGDHAADQQGTHRFGGLGLGLAISRQLVNLHGGSIEAASDGRGRGATFTVRFPLPVASNGESSPRPAALSAASQNPYASARILLVEDHEGTRRALELLLRKRGYQVTSAATLSEARVCAADENFDLLVSDLGLPDGDGTTLMAELRDRQAMRGIALTGYGMEEDIVRCLAAGFVTHLTKPIAIGPLEEALTKAFRARHGGNPT